MVTQSPQQKASQVITDVKNIVKQRNLSYKASYHFIRGYMEKALVDAYTQAEPNQTTPSRFQVEKENNLFLIYDSQRDIFVDRHENPNTLGLLTEAEAIATAHLLNNK